MYFPDKIPRSSSMKREREKNKKIHKDHVETEQTTRLHKSYFLITETEHLSLAFALSPQEKSFFCIDQTVVTRVTIGWSTKIVVLVAQNSFDVQRFLLVGMRSMRFQPEMIQRVLPIFIGQILVRPVVIKPRQTIVLFQSKASMMLKQAERK